MRFVFSALILTLLAVDEAHSRQALPGTDETERLRFQRHVFEVDTVTYGAILKDRDGFLWLGTIGLGLLKYDGWKAHRFEEGARGPAGSMICALAEDREGGIWCASLSKGLMHYDRNKGAFTHYRHDPEDANSPSADALPFTPQALLVDSQNRVWLGTDGGGLSRFDIATGQWTRYEHTSISVQGLKGDTVHAIVEGLDGHIWIATRRNGLNRYDPERDHWTHYVHDPERPGGLGDNWILSLLVDRNGGLWIGTHSAGLSHFDPHSEAFTHYRHDPADPGSLAHDEIWSLTEDSHGSLWICHRGPDVGLERFDPKSGVIVKYAHDPSDPSSISSNNVTGIVEDEETGIFWVLNFSGVIDQHDPQRRQFDTWSVGIVEAICEDSAKRLWVGTTHSGLGRLDRETGTFSQFLPDPDQPLSLPHKNILTIYEDRNGRFWLGTWQGYLVLFDRDLERCVEIWHHREEDPDSLTTCRAVKVITQDGEDNDVLWIGTIDGGLERFDIRDGVFEHFEHRDEDPNSLGHNTITSILEPGDGTLWLTTYGGGLNHFDKKTGRFQRFLHDPKDLKSLPSNTLYQVATDREDRLWVSSKGGFSRWDSERQQFDTWNRHNGLPSNVISCFFEDDSGFFWLSSIDEGLIRFDPRDGSSRQYTRRDGLQSNSFFWNSGAKGRDGRMWFGGSKGISSFDPESLTENDYVPPIVLTSLTQGGEPLEGVPAPERLRDVELDWNQNFFEFEFAALNFTSSSSNRYAYRLEGRDKDWYYCEGEPVGRYTGLEGGTYTLRLKGSNNDGVWNEVGTSLRITVVPAFWATKASRAAVSIVLVGIVLAIVAYSVRLRHEINQRRVAEGERANLEVQLRHSQKMEAIGRLAGGVAHDFNNVLTTILGNAELAAEILAGGKHKPGGDPNADVHFIERNLREIKHGAEHAASLTRQLLAFSRRHVTQPKNVDLNETLANLEQMLLRLLTEDISLALDLVDSQPVVRLDVGQLEQVVLNLVVNARDALPEGGRIRIGTEVSNQGEEPRVVLFVEDNGHGMDESTRERIFEPFFSTKPMGEGTGLGLSMVYGIVQQAGGTLDVESAPGDGTTFRISLPLIQAPPTSPLQDTKSVTPGEVSETVLLCEDEASVLEYGTRVLGQVGYKVIGVRSAEEALALPADDKKDVAILVTDVILPGIHGRALADRLGLEIAGLRVLFLSGYTSDVITPRGVPEEGIELLEKPFTKESLQKRVRQVLDSAQPFNESVLGRGSRE